MASTPLVDTTRHDACASDLCKQTWADDANTQVETIDSITVSHGLLLNHLDSTVLLGFLAYNSPHQTILHFLVKKAMIVQHAPTALIFKSAVGLLGHYAFANSDAQTAVKGRHVPVARHVETPLYRAVQEHLAMLSNDAVTLVVGGPSGGGKTFALVSQASPVSQTAGSAPATRSGLDVIAAYLRPTESVIDDANLLGLDQPTRDAAVLKWLVNRLADGYTIPTQTFVHMSKLPSDAPLRVLVIVDEMGAFRLATRALCRLEGADVRRELEAKVKHKLANVHFFIAVAGTGIGSAEEDTAPDTNKPFVTIGSESSSFRFLSAFDGAPCEDAYAALRANLEIFWSQVGPSMPAVKCEKHLHPLVRAFASENARMAAIVGAEISKNINGSAFPDQDLSLIFRMIDQSSFLTAATLRFKQLNGLESVAFDELWGLLVKAVRMHFFPHALTRGSKAFEVRYGLVVGRSLLSKASTEAKASSEVPIGYSPVGLPSVSVMLLAQMMGVPALTKSIVSGMALEEYALSALFLIACAACDSELFRLALDYQGGVLVPLKDDAVLPKSTDNTLVSIVYDLSRDAVPEPATPDGANEGAAEVVESRLVSEVSRVLEALGPMRCTNKSYTYVAALRSYDKASSADIILFIDAELFLFQCKDTRIKVYGAERELRKMGAEETTNRTSRATLVGLVRAWHKATGVRVTAVHMCFLTPNAVGVALRSFPSAGKSIECVGASGEKWRAVIGAKVRCVSVSELRFLRFDADRARAPPYASGVLPESLFVKSEVITPPQKDAPPSVKRASEEGQSQADALEASYELAEGRGGRRVEGPRRSVPLSLIISLAAQEEEKCEGATAGVAEREEDDNPNGRQAQDPPQPWWRWW